MSAKKRNNGRGGSFVFSSLSAILICVVLIFGVSVFFRVSAFQVEGASKYTSEEIISASGIKEGKNLIFLDRSAAEKKISESLVYVWKVQVNRKLPNTVSIKVWEGDDVACVWTEDGYWCTDSHCRLLEPRSAAQAEGMLRITGFTVKDPKEGEVMTVNDEDAAKVEYLKNILTALEEADMLGAVQNMDLSTSGNPQFIYLNRFRVKLGGSDGLESKLGLLKSAVETLKPEEKGIMDLSGKDSVHFSPGSIE